ncbi:MULTISPECIES: hypothetical protein [Fusobacterium]|jgi:hypothetical protein|uniref:hypothetical protein n=1 Tax=Fusobacterium TaxID=848 RepID=UPI0030C701B0
MTTRNQKIYFYCLTLKQNTSTDLESLLDLYRKSVINQVEVVIVEEKEIWLSKQSLNNDAIILTYEISNFGIRENIKERETKINAGVITENQYIEKYQHIILKKIDKNNYNVIFQAVQSGITYNFFLKILVKYFRTLNFIVTLFSKVYYQSNFFERISNLKTLKSLEIEGRISDDRELEFAGIHTNEFELKSKVETKIKAKKGFKSFLRAGNLEEFIKKEKAKYEKFKVTIKGENKDGNIEEILSEEIQINKSLGIKLTSENKLDISDLLDKMLKEIEMINNNNYIALDDKMISINNDDE